MIQAQQPLRILAIAELWQGSDAYAYVRAFRRAGHSVAALDSAQFLPPGWKRPWLRAIRRTLDPFLVGEYERELITQARRLRPHLFFSFKGPFVTKPAMAAVRDTGAVSINFYPDVSVTAQGKYIPQTLPLFDWVFTSKTFGLTDMKQLLGVTNASFMPHAFDPEVHAPFALDASDMERYGADVSFIGTWSPKKEQLLKHIQHALPQIKLRIWGAQWHKAAASLQTSIEDSEVFGAEYAKCLRATRVNLGLLSEVRKGASSGDLITARTFHIPGSGGFMLHERTDEVLKYFIEDEECAYFSDPDELVAKISVALAGEDRRIAIAAAGRRRCLSSGYSVDDRAARVIEKYRELAGSKSAAQGACAGRSAARQLERPASRTATAQAEGAAALLASTGFGIAKDHKA